MFEVKLNKDENKIEVFNISEFDFSNIKLSDPIKVEPKAYDSTLDALGLNVLIPVDNGEDFIYTYVSTNFLGDKLYSPKILIGRRYSELFSFAKSTLDWLNMFIRLVKKLKLICISMKMEVLYLVLNKKYYWWMENYLFLWKINLI